MKLKAFLGLACLSAVGAWVIYAATCTSAISSDFNGTPVASGDTLWFNANFKLNSPVSDGTTLIFTGQTITYSNGGPVTLSVPDNSITFSSATTCPSTTFNGASWVTQLPLSAAKEDEIFLSGLADKLAAPLPAGIKGVTWQVTVPPGASISWDWSVAAYTTFPAMTALDVKSVHQVASGCAYNNGDHAGTPENALTYLTGGPRGGGGSNYTGSWSGNGSITCPASSNSCGSTTGDNIQLTGTAPNCVCPSGTLFAGSAPFTVTNPNSAHLGLTYCTGTGG